MGVRHRPIVLQMTRSSGAITPCLEVREHKASGDLVPVPNGRVCAAPAARLNLLLEAGTYYVYADDEGSDGIGSYDLVYLRVTDVDAEVLEWGEVVSEALGPVGDVDPYTFDLIECSTVDVRATRVTGGVSPCVELRRGGENGAVEGGTAWGQGDVVDEVERQLACQPRQQRPLGTPVPLAPLAPTSPWHPQDE